MTSLRKFLAPLALLAVCLTVQADLAAFTKCISGFEDSAGQDMCKVRLPDLIRCHAAAEASLSADEKQIALAFLEKKQGENPCKDVDMVNEPNLEAENGGLKFEVSADQDVRFRRAELKEVSVFALKTKLDSIEGAVTKQIAEAKAEVQQAIPELAKSLASTSYVDTIVGKLKDQVDSNAASSNKLIDTNTAATGKMIDLVKDTIDAKVQALERASTKAAENIAQLKKDLQEEHASAVKSIQEKEEEIQKKIDDLFATKIAELDGKLGQIKTTVDGVSGKLQKVEEKVQEIPDPSKLSAVMTSLATTHYADSSVPIVRWNMWHTYQHRSSWFVGNNNELYGGVAPSTWTNSRGSAWNIHPEFKYLRALFKRKATGDKFGMNVCSETYIMHSSTTALMCGAVFRIKNSKNKRVTWSPYFSWTSCTNWGERASVSLNGQNVFSRDDNTHGIPRSRISLSLEGGRTSTVIFVVGSNYYYHVSGNYERATVLGFYGNSLNLPDGLEYVDDLDTVQGRWR